MRHNLASAGVVGVLLLAGCSGGSAEPAAGPTEPAAAATNTDGVDPAAQRPCTDLFRPGRSTPAPTHDDTSVACTGPDGTFYVLPGFRCADGSFLWSIDVAGSGVKGFGIAGRPFQQVTGDMAATAAYGKAYRACNG